MHNFLDGLRVIELGHILLGPYAGQSLGDLGADVIKVESPEGDYYRTAGVKRNQGMSSQWMNCNRNKRSIVLDLKSVEGAKTLKRLLANADIFIHNMRPKAVTKLGFNYESVKAINPGIVYCFSSGFGSNGPYAEYPAFDDIIQAYSGLASLNGVNDGVPKLTPVPVTDFISSLHLTQAILAAMFRKSQTGKGCMVEVPMFETMTGMVMNQHLNGHGFRPPVDTVGYQRMLSPDRAPCATQDGFIVHGVYSLKHWTKFLKAVDRTDILESGLLLNADTLSSNLAYLYKVVREEIIPHRSTQAWLEFFRQIDVPAAPVLNIEDLEDNVHLKAVNTFRDYIHPTEGYVREIRSSINVVGIDEQADVPPPTLGQDTEEILRELDIKK